MPSQPVRTRRFLSVYARCRSAAALVALALLVACAPAADESAQTQPTSPDASATVDTPTAAPAAPAALRTTADAPGLRTVTLTILGGRVDADGLTLTLDVHNHHPRALALLGTLSAEDARLLSGDGLGGVPVPPRRVDPALAPLEPAGGLRAGARVRGEIAFPPPRDSDLDRAITFSLPPFAPLTFAPGALTPATRSTDAAAVVAAHDRPTAAPRRAPAPTSAAPSIGAVEIVASSDDVGTRSAARGAVTSRRPGAVAPADAPSRAQQQIDALLTDQARALVRGDLDGYLATFAPARRAAERRVLRQLRDLPLAALTLTLDDGDASIRPADGFARTREATVVLRYTLRQLPTDNPMVHRLRYRLQADREDRLQVTAIEDDPSRPVPWRVETMVRVMRGPIVGVGPAPQRDALEIAVDEAAAAYALLRRRGAPLEDVQLVMLTPRVDRLRALRGTDDARADDPIAVAAVRYALGADGNLLTDSRALPLSAAAFAPGGTAPAARRGRLLHELALLALAPDTRPYTPLWLREGTAAHLAAGGLDRARGRRLTGASLDGLAIAALSRRGAGAAIAAEHSSAYAHAAVTYLVTTHGWPTFLRFYRRFAALETPQAMLAIAFEPVALARFGAGDVGTLALPVTEEALRYAYSLTPDRLDAETRTWLRRTYR
ncbi:MAG: hypothetical protein AAF772_08360 [Acidobacteriota bacterium]